MKLTLKEITALDEERVMAYKQDFIQHQDSLDGTAGLQDAESFTSWLANIQDNRKEETLHEGLVIASTFLVEDESKNLIGFLDVRHELNDYLMKLGGHIGYSVLKKERRQGYATEILRLGLQYCRSLGIKNVLVTCDDTNIGSQKAILNNEGLFENCIDHVNRYWIHLD